MKVAIIEPGTFPTNIIKPERFVESLQAAWNQIGPELKEVYGQEFLAASK